MKTLNGTPQRSMPYVALRARRRSPTATQLSRHKIRVLDRKRRSAEAGAGRGDHAPAAFIMFMSALPRQLEQFEEQPLPAAGFASAVA